MKEDAKSRHIEYMTATMDYVIEEYLRNAYMCWIESERQKSPEQRGFYRSLYVALMLDTNKCFDEHIAVMSPWDINPRLVGAEKNKQFNELYIE